MRFFFSICIFVLSAQVFAQSNASERHFRGTIGAGKVYVKLVTKQDSLAGWCIDEQTGIPRRLFGLRKGKSISITEYTPDTLGGETETGTFRANIAGGEIPSLLTGLWMPTKGESLPFRIEQTGYALVTVSFLRDMRAPIGDTVFRSKATTVVITGMKDGELQDKLNRDIHGELYRSYAGGIVATKKSPNDSASWWDERQYAVEYMTKDFFSATIYTNRSSRAFDAEMNVTGYTIRMSDGKQLSLGECIREPAIRKIDSLCLIRMAQCAETGIDTLRRSYLSKKYKSIDTAFTNFVVTPTGLLVSLTGYMFPLYKNCAVILVRWDEIEGNIFPSSPLASVAAPKSENAPKQKPKRK